MTIFDTALIAGGLVAFVLGAWLLKRFAALPDGSSRLKSEVGNNFLIFAVMGLWCVGLITVGVGLGLGGMPVVKA